MLFGRQVQSHSHFWIWKSQTEDKHGFLSLQNVPRSSLNLAKSIGNGFWEYFISTEGWVSWQYMYIKFLIRFVD